MRWKVQLEGHTSGLEDLSESFDEDPRIFEEGEEYYLWSSQFEQLDESVEVRDVGEDIVRAVRHLGQLDSLRVGELETSGVVEIQDDGSERMILHASVAAVDADIASVRLSVGGEELPPIAESTYEYTRLALNDDKVQELVELRDNGDHWVNLYRVYEYIRDNTEGDENTVERGWWSNSEKSLFTHTANSPEAIGHEARHHGSGGPPSPADPMTHSEAKSVINKLVENWIKHRRELIEE